MLILAQIMTTKFEVKYSLQKDCQIYLQSIWKPSWVDYGTSDYEIGKKYFPLSFLDNLKNALDKNSAKKIVLKYWAENRGKSYDQGTKLICKWFNRFLNEEQEHIVGRLEKIYGKPFPFLKITVYLTSYFCCPYNFNQLWYMVSRNANFWSLLDTSVHELNHFMFYFYFLKRLEKQRYSQKSIEFLKEALAILTSNNPKSENIDKPDVLPLQNFIRENNEKSVDQIIDLVIKNKLLEKIK